MEIDEKIQRLDEFKQAVLDWSASYRDEARRKDLRSYINQNKVWVRQQIIEAGCFHTLTIGPPPAVGGLVMQNVDPFAMLFSPPYGVNMFDQVGDMIDQTIGVLRAPVEVKSVKDNEPKVELSIERNYAFVAMAIDPDNPEGD